MPGHNGRGPEGEGPRTGRGLGNCRPRADEDVVLNEAERNQRTSDGGDALPEVPRQARDDEMMGFGRGGGRGFGRGGRGSGRGGRGFGGGGGRGGGRR